MKSDKIYFSCFLLLLVILSVSVKAQEKTPDMTRYSNAPLKAGGAKTGARSAGVRPSRSGTPDMSRFSKAPIQAGGGQAAARSVARASGGAAKGTTPSDAPAAITNKKKNATPAGLPDAAKEQMNITPVEAPAKKSAQPAAKKS